MLSVREGDSTREKADVTPHLEEPRRPAAAKNDVVSVRIKSRVKLNRDGIREHDDSIVLEAQKPAVAQRRGQRW